MNLRDTVSRPVLITSAVVAGLGPLVGNGLYAGPEAKGRPGGDALAGAELAGWVSGWVWALVLLRS